LKLKKGLVQVYTGEGKGKTTAALGLAMRAIGSGLKVYMFQFLKGRDSGELNTARILAPNFVIEQDGSKALCIGKQRSDNDIRLAQNLFKKARDITCKGDYDVVILDEINVAVHLGLVSVEQVLSLIKEKPEHVELILTGRYVSPEIIKVAHLVTEMTKIKHHYDEGIEARKGIDY